MTKRLLSVFLAIVFVVGAVLPASAAKNSDSKYNPDDALAYAEDHWDDGKGLCAEFVSDCLEAGGVDDTYERMVSNLYNGLKNNDWGTSYKLTLTDGTSGRISMAENKGKVEAGDPIFYYCNSCKSFTHAVLCNGANSDGYLVDYAHNNPHDGTHVTWTFPHCGTNNWTIYSIRMSDTEKLYGKVTSVTAPKISEIENTKDGAVIKWNAIEGADKYRFYRKTTGTSWKLIETVTEPTYTDTNAENGVKYLYTVKAVEDNVASQYYAGTENIFLSSVAKPSVKNKHTKLQILWNKNESADGYYVYRKVADGNWERYRDFTSGDTTSFYDTKVSSGTRYYYKVCAFKGEYVSTENSDSKKFLFLEAPELVSLGNASKGLTLKWNAVDGANKYMVYKRGPGEKKWKLIDTVTTTTYTDKNVEGGSVYRYTVKSAKNNALGGYNTSGIKRKRLLMPTFTSVSSSKSKVTLKWKSVKGATGYYLYRKLKGEKSWKRVATVKGKTNYIDSAVKVGKTYTYTVRAYYGTAKSAYSSKGADCLVIKGTAKSVTSKAQADFKASIPNDIVEAMVTAPIDAMPVITATKNVPATTEVTDILPETTVASEEIQVQIIE